MFTINFIFWASDSFGAHITLVWVLWSREPSSHDDMSRSGIILQCIFYMGLINVLLSPNMAWYQFVHFWSGEAIVYWNTVIHVEQWFDIFVKYHLVVLVDVYTSFENTYNYIGPRLYQNSKGQHRSTNMCPLFSLYIFEFSGMCDHPTLQHTNTLTLTRKTRSAATGHPHTHTRCGSGGGPGGPGPPLTLGFEAPKLSIFGPYLIFP